MTYQRSSWVMVGIVALTVLSIVAMIWGSYIEAQRPSFSLKKDDWTCTKSHTETSTYFIQSGNVLLPVTDDHVVCDSYTRVSERKK